MDVIPFIFRWTPYCITDDPKSCNLSSTFKIQGDHVTMNIWIYMRYTLTNGLIVPTPEVPPPYFFRNTALDFLLPEYFKVIFFLTRCPPYLNHDFFKYFYFHIIDFLYDVYICIFNYMKRMKIGKTAVKYKMKMYYS